jgi:hypothetical protein
MREMMRFVHWIGLEMTALLIALEIPWIYPEYENRYLYIHGFGTMNQYTIPSSITDLQLYRSRSYHHLQYRSRGGGKMIIHFLN